MSDYIDKFIRPIEIEPHHTALVVIDMQHASGSQSWRWRASLPEGERR